MKRQIRKQIKDYRDGREYMQFDSKELFKPIIIAQKEVKETIDKKQDKLIEKLQENQNELIGSVDALSDTISKQGSVGRVGRWLSDLPSSFDRLDTIEEEGEGDGDDKNVDDKKVVDTFNPKEKEIIKKYGFDPGLVDLPTEEAIKQKITSLTGKRNSKNKIIKEIAMKDQKTLSDFLSVVKGAKKALNNVEKAMKEKLG